MALKLYRRHCKECEAGHPEDSKMVEVRRRLSAAGNAAAPDPCLHKYSRQIQEAVHRSIGLGCGSNCRSPMERAETWDVSDTSGKPSNGLELLQLLQLPFHPAALFSRFGFVQFSLNRRKQAH